VANARRLFYTVAVTTSIVIATATASAASPAFCSGLKSVAAETGNGFERLRGAQLSVRHGTSGLTYTDYTYAATSSLLGAIPSTCQIVTTVDAGTASGAYRCFFAYGSHKRLDKLGNIMDDITACIGPTSEDNIDVDTDNDVGDVEFDRPTFKISLSASDSQPLVLLISKPTP